MTEYHVYPKGTQALFELMMEKGSPGAEFFDKIGGRPYVCQGLPGLRVGEVFYSANPNYINVLTVKGTGSTPYSIEMPVTSIYLEPQSLTFIDQDSHSRLKVTAEGFALDMGESVELKP